MTVRETEVENVREKRDALRALTVCVQLLERVRATSWEGRHSVKCRTRKRLLADIRAALDGGLYLSLIHI